MIIKKKIKIKITAVANKLTIGRVFKYVKLKKRSIKTINSGSRPFVVGKLETDDGLEPTEVSDFLFTFCSIKKKTKRKNFCLK